MGQPNTKKGELTDFIFFNPLYNYYLTILALEVLNMLYWKKITIILDYYIKNQKGSIFFHK